MKLRAIHIIRHLERIERDLEELRKLDSTLKGDRPYAARLKGSVQDETIRLEQIKERLLQQVVRAPDETAAAPEVRLPPPERRPGPEIILPDKSQPQKSRPVKKPVKEPEKKKTFEFRYN